MRTARRVLSVPLLVGTLAVCPAAAYGQAVKFGDGVVMEAGPVIHRSRALWNIGFHRVLTEVSYQNLEVLGASAAAELAVWKTRFGTWTLWVEWERGVTRSGRGRDSDYYGAEGAESYRAVVDITGDEYRSLAGGIGLQRRFCAGRCSFGVWGGAQQLEHQLRMQNGMVQLPIEEELRHLDSTFRYGWEGPWLGVGATTSKGRLHLRGFVTGYPWLLYTAEGWWNLRTDLELPSFNQVGIGGGYGARLSGALDLGPHVRLRAGLRWQSLSVVEGQDQLHKKPETNIQGELVPARTVTTGLLAATRRALSGQITLQVRF